MTTKNPISMHVKKAGTREFFSASGRWTHRMDMAINFPNLLTVIHTCLAEGLDQVEVLIRSDGEADDCFPLNLTQSRFRREQHVLSIPS